MTFSLCGGKTKMSPLHHQMRYLEFWDVIHRFWKIKIQNIEILDAIITDAKIIRTNERHDHTERRPSLSEVNHCHVKRKERKGPVRYNHPKPTDIAKSTLCTTWIHLEAPNVCMWYIVLVLRSLLVLGGSTLLWTTHQTNWAKDHPHPIGQGQPSNYWSRPC